MSISKFNKGAIWVSAGILAGAGIGTGIGFLVLNFHEKYDGEPVHPGLALSNGGSYQNDLPIADRIKEYESGIPERERLLGDNGMKLLMDKLSRRLGYGPEIQMLKAIYIQKPTSFMEGSNGVYFGATNEIFINSQTIWNVFERAKNRGMFSDYNYNNHGLNEDKIDEFIAEFTFQIIYHEYGHHIAYTYLNNMRVNDQFSNTYVKDSAAGNSISEVERWSKGFYDQFRKTLKYDDASVPHPSVPDFHSSDGTTYRAVNGSFNPKQVFDLANDQYSSHLLPTSPNTKWAFFGKDGQPYLTVTDSTLKYNWSMAELFARKMQQATMTFESMYNSGLADLMASNPNEFEKSIFGMDQTVFGSRAGTSIPIEFSPYRLDSLNYLSEFGKSPFFGDYLFDKDNNTNATELYNALTKEMGYQDKADISKIWWNNEAKIDGEGKVLYPKQTDSINFGGFINRNDYTHIGYLDTNNNFVPISEITINEFTYKSKESIDSQKPNQLDNTKDNYYYTLKDFVSASSIEGKNLVLARYIPSTDKISGDKSLITHYSKLSASREKLFDKSYPNDEYLYSLDNFDNSRRFANLYQLSEYKQNVNTFLSRNSDKENTGINSRLAQVAFDQGHIRIEVK